MEIDQNEQPAPTRSEATAPVAAPKAPSSFEPQAVASKTNPDDTERWLWTDPLAADDRVKAGAVLLDDVIQEYVHNYNLLIDENSFQIGKLKGGSYTMTPAVEDAWRFTPGKKPGEPDLKVALQKGRDHLGEFFWVPRNSLVYIKLKQKLRLPFYIIGRHNLKIRYVYKGLLLGTGPQVDPGFHGNLFIPLHNFTTSDVKVHIEQSFVSIDFVRTTRFIDPTAASASNLVDLRKQLSGTRALIEEFKVTHRTTLEDYLEGATPRSQMAQFQFDFEKLSGRVEKDLRNAKTWMSVERLAVVLVVAGLLITSLNLFRGLVADFREKTKEVKALIANTDVGALNGRVSSLEALSVRVAVPASNQMPPLSLSSSSSIAQFEDKLKALERELSQWKKGHTNY